MATMGIKCWRLHFLIVSVYEGGWLVFSHTISPSDCMGKRPTAWGLLGPQSGLFPGYVEDIYNFSQMLL